MSVTYKDIDDLSQKSLVAGTEKLPVSDTEYITPSQVVELSGVSVSDNLHATDLDIADDSGNVIASFADGNIRTKNFDSRIVPKYMLLESKADYDALTTKDSGTLYLIPKTSE